MKTRCAWSEGLEIYERYHDEEWGVPVYDDQLLFQKLILDGFQAGLSWLTILKKRENFIVAFDQFDYHKIAKYDEAKIQELLGNAGIVRNKLKVRGTVLNAQLTIDIINETGSFSDYLWSFVDGKPIINNWKSMAEVPATSKESDAMSKALKKKGFKFVGSTIIYAFMQAVGMVDDHVQDCWRRQ